LGLALFLKSLSNVASMLKSAMNILVKIHRITATMMNGEVDNERIGIS